MQNELTLPCKIKTDPRRRICVTRVKTERPAAESSKIERTVEILSELISSGCCLAMIYLVYRLI